MSAVATTFRNSTVMPPIKIIGFGVIGICAAHDKRVTSVQFLRIGLPITAVQLSVGTLYVWVLFSILG